MKYTLPILACALFVYGVLLSLQAIYGLGLGFYTPLLTVAVFVGLVTLSINRNVGLIILFAASTGWLLRYMEHAGFLILYRTTDTTGWIVIGIPILLSFAIFLLIIDSYLQTKNKKVEPVFIAVSFFIFLFIGFLSFAWKKDIQEINCWYTSSYSDDSFDATFSTSPESTFEATVSSPDLRTMLSRDAITYARMEGYYCPETKLRVTRRFKKIVGIEIIGFRNTDKGKLVRFDDPIEIDMTTVKGDLSSLEPYFTIGD